MSLLFRINDELVDISISDDDKRAKLTDDNPFTIKFLRRCVRAGKIILSEPIRLITRRISDTEEELVYNEGPLEHVELISDEQPATSNDQECIFNEELLESHEEPHEYEEFISHEDHMDNEEERMDNAEEGMEDEEDLNHISPPPKAKQRRASELWAENHTKLILDNFHSYLKEIGPMKRFKTKKHMWQQIAKDLLKEHNIIKSAVQVENRYKTIVRRKKNAVVNNSQTGRSRQTVPFAAEMSKIASLDDSIAPQVIRSAKSVRTFKEPIVDDDSESDNEMPHSKRRNDSSTLLMNKKIHKRKSSSIAETLVRLNEEKEACREARHREKLELIRNIFGK